MNKDQFIYDTKVQIYNRTIEIPKVLDRINKLKRIRADIYQRGQQDKLEKQRKETLLEYKQKIAEFDGNIDTFNQLVNEMRRKNGEPIESAAMRNARLSKRFGSRRRRSKSVGKNPIKPTELTTKSMKSTDKLAIKYKQIAEVKERKRHAMERLIQSGEFTYVSGHIADRINEMYMNGTVGELGVIEPGETGIQPGRVVTNEGQIVPLSPVDLFTTKQFDSDSNSYSDILHAIDLEIKEEESKGRDCCW